MTKTAGVGQTEEMAVEEKALEDLKTRLRGELILPGSPGYDESRSVWNAMIDRRPAVIVRPLGVPDIITGIRFAREQGLPLSVKGGGHNIAGLAVADAGLRGFSTGGSYINFQTEDEGVERIRAAYGKNYGRLVEIKTKWDPGNLFRTNKNIAPR